MLYFSHLSSDRTTLTVLKETDALETIARVGTEIQALLSRVFTKLGIEHCFAGPDAMFGVHWVVKYRKIIVIGNKSTVTFIHSSRLT